MAVAPDWSLTKRLTRVFMIGSLCCVADVQRAEDYSLRHTGNVEHAFASSLKSSLFSLMG